MASASAMQILILRQNDIFTSTLYIRKEFNFHKTGFEHQYGCFYIMCWATNMPDVTSCENAAFLYIFILYFWWCLVKCCMKMKPSSKDSFQLCWHQRFVKVFNVLLKVFQCSCRLQTIFSLERSAIISY